MQAGHSSFQINEICRCKCKNKPHIRDKTISHLFEGMHGMTNLLVERFCKKTGEHRKKKIWPQNIMLAAPFFADIFGIGTIVISYQYVIRNPYCSYPESCAYKRRQHRASSRRRK